MGANMRFYDDDKIEAFTDQIVKDVEGAKKRILKRGGDVVKSEVEKALPRSAVFEGKRPHMQDDVKAAFEQDKEYGGERMKVKGGKKTGTLWHLVNDGTSKMSPTHFMDKAMNNADPSLEAIIDEEMSKG